MLKGYPTDILNITDEHLELIKDFEVNTLRKGSIVEATITTKRGDTITCSSRAVNEDKATKEAVRGVYDAFKLHIGEIPDTDAPRPLTSLEYVRMGIPVEHVRRIEDIFVISDKGSAATVKLIPIDGSPIMSTTGHPIDPVRSAVAAAYHVAKEYIVSREYAQNQLTEQVLSELYHKDLDFPVGDYDCGKDITLKKYELPLSEPLFRLVKSLHQKNSYKVVTLCMVTGEVFEVHASSGGVEKTFSDLATECNRYFMNKVCSELDFIKEAVATTPPTADTENHAVYIGTKAIRAAPMTKGEYNDKRGFKTNPKDYNEEGFMVEYLGATSKPNTNFANGYISWSPRDVFMSSYRTYQ